VEVQGAGVVITGAGHGIGRAVARRLAKEGARVVVNDLDAEAAAAVADEIGGYAAPGDAASERGVEALLSRATADLGAIDAYFANAGVAAGTGLDSDEEDWQLSFEVNVMAHIRAARALVPQWLQRGGGRFVATVSAAGLLTMLGGAPYSVSKHAALAHAEWLSVTYGHRGITVQCICPQGVRTQMLADAGTAGEVLMAATAMEPEDVADVVMEGLRDDRFLVLPHPEVADYYALRATETERWLAGMRKLQRRIDDAGTTGR
jgi:NAD(P)-dependent dehydrogenase (short-subunit alcohol dehydrogenase family)